MVAVAETALMSLVPCRPKKVGLPVTASTFAPSGICIDVPALFFSSISWIEDFSLRNLSRNPISEKCGGAEQKRGRKLEY